MIGPALFAVALGLMLAWGAWRRRRLPSYWPGRPETTQQQLEALGAAFLRVRITVVDGLTPALKRAAVAAGELAEALRRALEGEQPPPA